MGCASGDGSIPVRVEDLFRRRKTRPVRCGNLIIGGGAPILVQTMTKCDTRDVEATVDEIIRAHEAGADIVRVAVPDLEAARALSRIKQRVPCPVVADIHFDYRLALASLDSGADKVRINPGNIGGPDRLLEVARRARETGAAIRIGVNAGSLEKEVLAVFGEPSAEALVYSARRHIRFLEDNGVEGLVVSLKSSSVRETTRAYCLMARETDWPFHVGITEAGPGLQGVIKSSAGIGALMVLGLCDTIRVSLTGPSIDEVIVARRIIQSVGERVFGPEVISCPTCGRTQVDLVPIAQEVAARVEGMRVPLTIAVMGCPVNGPGEAREADVGLACGRDGGILFSRGKVIGRVPKEKMVEALMELVEKHAKESGGCGLGTGSC